MATEFRNVAKKAHALVDDQKYADNAISFLDELLDKVPQYIQSAKAARELNLQAEYAKLEDGDATKAPPAAVLAAIEAVRMETEFVIKAMNAVSLYIFTKMPEIKEEDNAGVAVQMHVMETIGQVKAICETGSGGGKSADPRFCALGFKLSYLKARGEMEEKLNPKKEKEEKKDDKDAAPASPVAPAFKSPSARMAIEEFDRNAMADVAATYMQLRRMGTMAARTFTINIEKVACPRRRDGAGMIG